jgi:hypothetical protein
MKWTRPEGWSALARKASTPLSGPAPAITQWTPAATTRESAIASIRTSMPFSSVSADTAMTMKASGGMPGTSDQTAGVVALVPATSIPGGTRHMDASAIPD